MPVEESGLSLKWVYQRRFKRKPHTSVSPPIPDVSQRVAPLGDQSVDARRGAAVDGELREAAGAAAWAVPDKRGVTRLQAHIFTIQKDCGTGRFGQWEQHLHC